MTPRRLTIRRGRGAFTAIEMLVVILIVLLLMSIGIPTYAYVQQSSRIHATRTLLHAVGLAIEAYQNRGWSVYVPAAGGVPGHQVVYRTWDWNDDQVLDGFPEAEVTGITAVGHPDHTLYTAGYRGFYTMARPVVSERSHNALGQLVDSWNRPLQIAFAAEIYGAGGYGLWSTGPDRLDGPAGSAAAADNITSWGEP